MILRVVHKCDRESHLVGLCPGGATAEVDLDAASRGRHHHLRSEEVGEVGGGEGGGVDLVGHESIEELGLSGVNEVVIVISKHETSLCTVHVQNNIAIGIDEVASLGLLEVNESLGLWRI